MSRAGGKQRRRGRRRPGESTPAPPARRRWSAVGVAEAILWLLVVAVPLAVLPTARDPFALPKLVLGQWLALASVLVLAGGAAAAGRFSLARPWRRPAVRLALPLLATAFLAWAFTNHRPYADAGLGHLAVAAAALVGWSAGLDGRRLRRLLTGILVPASLVGLLAVLQFHGLYRVFGFAGGLEAERQGVVSLAGNPGHLGSFLALALVVALARLVPRHRSSGRGSDGAPGRGEGVPAAGASRGLRLALLLALVPVVYGLVVTQTLAALAAAGAGSVVVAVLALPRRRAAVLLGVALVAAVLVVVAVEPLRERAVGKLGDLAEGEVNRVLTGRLDGWRAAAWMVGQHPWTGVGPGAYVTEYNTARLALLDAGVPVYRGHVDPTFASAHNEPLQVAAEWGWPGLVALLWALGVLGRAVVRVVRQGRRTGAPGDAALAAGGLAVLAVLALFHFPFRLALTGFPALLWCAWVLARSAEPEGAAGAAAEEAGETAAEGGGHGFPRRAEVAVAWAVVALLVAGLFVHTVHARDVLRASRIVNAVERTTTLAVERGGAPNTLLWTHLRMLREAEALDPASFRPLLARGVQYLLMDRPEEAAEAYRRALEQEPRPELWVGLGQALWQAGEEAAAVEAFATALRLYPRLQPQVPAAARPAVAARLRGLEAER